MERNFSMQIYWNSEHCINYSRFIRSTLQPMCIFLQSSAVREINGRNEAMSCLLILSTSSLYIARIANIDACSR